MKKSTSVRRGITLALCALALAALASASSVGAATLTVTSLNDSGQGSLRVAIASAAAGDRITFKIKGTITLTSGALVINQDLTIEGPGANKLRISGNHASRVFVIEGGNENCTSPLVALSVTWPGAEMAMRAILPVMLPAERSQTAAP